MELLAKREGVSRAVLLQQIRTRAILAHSIAALIVAGAVADADAHFDEGTPYPPDEAGMHGDIMRAHWHRREDERRREWEDATTYNEADDRATKEFFANLKKDAPA